jgi:phosphatidylethanolamine-binding protein (PEBP) family uncharacterized protein
MSLSNSYQTIPTDDEVYDDRSVFYTSDEPSTKHYKKFGIALFITMVSFFAAAVSLSLINLSAKKGPTNLKVLRDYKHIYGTDTGSDFKLGSIAFPNNGTLPDIYTCKNGVGSGVSPPLNWSFAPEGTQDFMVVMWKQSGYSWSMYNLSSVDHVDAGEQIHGVTGGTVEFNPNDKHVTKFSYDEPCSKGPGSRTYIFYIFALSERISPFMARMGVHAESMNPIVITNAMSKQILAVAALPVHFTLYVLSKGKNENKVE